MLLSSFEGSQIQHLSRKKGIWQPCCKSCFPQVAVEGVFMKTSEAYFTSVASLQQSGIINILPFRIFPLGSKFEVKSRYVVCQCPVTYTALCVVFNLTQLIGQKVCRLWDHPMSSNIISRNHVAQLLKNYKKEVSLCRPR